MQTTVQTTQKAIEELAHNIQQVTGLDRLTAYTMAVRTFAKAGIITIEPQR